MVVRRPSNRISSPLALPPGRQLRYTKAVNPTGIPRTDIHSEAFLAQLKRRQLRLSVACAATFLVALLALPLLNYHFPEAMATRVGGFTLTWLVLGVLFFPFVWAIAWVFIRRSIALEDAEVREVESGKQESRKT